MPIDDVSGEQTGNSSVYVSIATRETALRERSIL
jgi:hypothetical protein